MAYLSPKGYTPVLVTIPISAADQIAAIAKARGISKSAYMRKALNAALSLEPERADA